MIQKIKFFAANKRIKLTGAISIILFIIAKPTSFSIILGIPIIVIGEAIRIWSSGYIRKDNQLATNGPYLFTRNPLYLGNFFLGLGFSIMSNNLIIIVLFSFFFFFIYQWVIEDEENYLVKKFGDEFARYKMDVPRFFPGIKRPGRYNNKKGFDWNLVKKHKEYNTWMGLLGGIGLFAIKMLIN
ncbi:MAG: methyltransferase family protein [Nitrospirota bacterium]